MAFHAQLTHLERPMRAHMIQTQTAAADASTRRYSILSIVRCARTHTATKSHSIPLLDCVAHKLNQHDRRNLAAARNQERPPLPRAPRRQAAESTWRVNCPTFRSKLVRQQELLLQANLGTRFWRRGNALPETRREESPHRATFERSGCSSSSTAAPNLVIIMSRANQASDVHRMPPPPTAPASPLRVRQSGFAFARQATRRAHSH